MSSRRPRLPSAPPLSADVEAQIQRQMSPAQYQDIRDYLERYADFLALRASPHPISPSQRQAFYTALQQHPYIQGLLTFGQLESALERLEDGYRNWFLDRVDEDEDPLSEDFVAAVIGAESALARRMRFIATLANAMGPGVANYSPRSTEHEQPKKREQPMEREQRERKRVLLQLLGKTHAKLDALLDDEVFCETLVDDEHLASLRRLNQDLAKAKGWLDVPILHPIKRHDKDGVETSTTRTRLLAYRLALASQRHFNVCTPDILRSLLAYPWLVPLPVAQLQRFAETVDGQETYQFLRPSTFVSLSFDRDRLPVPIFTPQTSLTK